MVTLFPSVFALHLLLIHLATEVPSYSSVTIFNIMVFGPLSAPDQCPSIHQVSMSRRWVIRFERWQLLTRWLSSFIPSPPPWEIWRKFHQATAANSHNSTASTIPRRNTKHQEVLLMNVCRRESIQGQLIRVNKNEEWIGWRWRRMKV